MTEHRVNRLLLEPFAYFIFANPATAAICTLSLHDALPIFGGHREVVEGDPVGVGEVLEVAVVGHDGGDLDVERPDPGAEDRKSTRLNSSHSQISYAVFCLKRKKALGRNASTMRHLCSPKQL